MMLAAVSTAARMTAAKVPTTASTEVTGLWRLVSAATGPAGVAAAEAGTSWRLIAAEGI